MRISKNEDILENSPTERVYFWCMKDNRNQKLSIEVCIRDKCHYLELSEVPLRCHCPVSMQYVNAFKGNWRKRREKKLEQEEKD